MNIKIMKLIFYTLWPVMIASACCYRDFHIRNNGINSVDQYVFSFTSCDDNLLILGIRSYKQKGKIIKHVYNKYRFFV